MEKSVPLLLVDKHAPLAIWLQSLLPLQGFGPVTVVDDSAQVAGAYDGRGVACVGDLDDADAVELTRRLTAAVPGARVVTYLRTPITQDPGEALDAGALAVCRKTGRLPDLLVALQHAAQGRRYVDPELGVYST